MITPAEFKIRFPEFSSEDDTRIQLFIDDSVVILNEPYWGTKFDMGLSYYTAHLLVIGTKTAAGSSGSQGSVTSRSVDGTSVSYGNSSTGDTADDFLASTAYGQRYLALRKTLGVPAYVI